MKGLFFKEEHVRYTSIPSACLEQVQSQLRLARSFLRHATSVVMSELLCSSNAAMPYLRIRLCALVAQLVLATSVGHLTASIQFGSSSSSHNEGQVSFAPLYSRMPHGMP